MGDARPVAEQAAVVIRIGTSGWSYDHWAPELYAAGLPAGHRLARYAAAFATAELNSSFYRWPRPAAFSSGRRKLPDSFRLSVKAPRGLTHGRRLYAPEAWLQRISAGWHELACMYLCPDRPVPVFSGAGFVLSHCLYTEGSMAIASIEMSRPCGSATLAGAERAGGGSGMKRA